MNRLYKGPFVCVPSFFFPLFSLSFCDNTFLLFGWTTKQFYIRYIFKSPKIVSYTFYYFIFFPFCSAPLTIDHMIIRHNHKLSRLTHCCSCLINLALLLFFLSFFLLLYAHYYYQFIRKFCFDFFFPSSNYMIPGLVLYIHSIPKCTKMKTIYRPSINNICVSCEPSRR